MKINHTKAGKYSITDLSKADFDLISDAFLLAAWKVNDTPAPLRNGKVNPEAVRGKEKKAEQFNEFRRNLHVG